MKKIIALGQMHIEVRRKKMAPRVPPFTVTQNHRNLQPTRIDWVPMISDYLSLEPWTGLEPFPR